METEHATMISSFLEIVVDQSHETAIQFLQAANWRLEEAIQLYYVGHECTAPSSSPIIPPPEENDDDDYMTSDEDEDEDWEMPEEVGEAVQVEEVISDTDSPIEAAESPLEIDNSGVRTPIPVKREVLYGASLYDYSFDDEEKKEEPGVWETEGGSTSAAKENLASLYRPPYDLMFNGSFEKAKEAGHRQDKWLLVNVQSTREFGSHMLNRDTWANEAVAQTITSNFIFWQIYDDAEEGCKVCTYYKLDSLPVTLVIDPITGQKMRLWRGMIQPASLLEDILQFMDSSPKDQHLSLSHKHQREIFHISPPKIQEETSEDDEDMRLARELSMGTMLDSGEVLKDSSARDEVVLKEKYNYPPLPEEPKGDKSLLCRVGVRLPEGKRLQRNFLRSDPIQLLWSFCAANCDEEKPIRLTHAIPGAVKDLEFESVLTFEQAGVSNSMISVTWKEL